MWRARRCTRQRPLNSSQSDALSPQAPPTAAPSAMPRIPSSGAPSLPNASTHSAKMEIGMVPSPISMGVVVSIGVAETAAV